ncbi:hypothetical protein Y049_39 [Burkholderia pseudomallei MSHR684]|nr:hypothetical protein Y049_39 [Burkholderia pseudomallei MSHR684]
MPFGLPFLTRNTIVDVYGDALSGRRFCQSLLTRPLFASASMSYASASVTTSACSPSSTERACAPEPPCDCLKFTVSPVLAFHSLPNAWLTSW